MAELMTRVWEAREFVKTATDSDIFSEIDKLTRHVGKAFTSTSTVITLSRVIDFLYKELCRRRKGWTFQDRKDGSHFCGRCHWHVKAHSLEEAKCPPPTIRRSLTDPTYDPRIT